ncbi:MAG TPA: GAF domain-containing protein, partial [Anaerolineales bacterium]|nr:GAF domain-containing protein [Anaerolineales bacterium]
ERSTSPERVRAQDLLVKLSDKDPGNIISYALVDANGIVLLDSDNSNVRKNESGEAYFPQVRFSEEPIVTPVTLTNGNTTIISFASKVLGFNGEYLGVLRVKYKAKVLQSVVSRNAGSTSDTLILLLDELNIRLADNRNPSLILKSIAPLTLIDYLLAVDSNRFLDLPREEQSTNFIELDNALDNAVEQPFFRVDITPNIPGDDTVAVAFMKTQPWVVTYSRPTAIFLAGVQEQTRTNTILVIMTSIMIAMITAFVARIFTNPIFALTNTANSISQGELTARADVTTSDEIGILATAFNSMADQLQTTLAGLEERIFDRTQDLQKSNRELETISEVAREIAIIRDLDTLLNVSTYLIRERLNYYHVGIFLVDERYEFAHLQAASSIASDKMLAQNIKFRINDIDPLATALRAGQVYYSPDISIDKHITRNPLLPDTVAEAIFPLRIRNNTIGALDIQASDRISLGERETNTLKLLADQLAAAVENAQLVQQVERTLIELTNANQAQTQQVWKAAINRRERPGFEYDGLQIKAVPQNIPADLLRRLESGQPVIVTDGAGSKQTKNSLLIPLTILNQVIGVIGLENDDPNHLWTDDDVAVAQAAANRATLSLENARLLEESQRRASREQSISQISVKIGEVTEIDTILKTAVRELGTHIGGAQVTVEIGGGDE